MPINVSEYIALIEESQARCQHVISLIGDIMETAQVNEEAAIGSVETAMTAEPAVVSPKMLPTALAFLGELKKQPHRFVERKPANAPDQRRADALTKHAAEELGKAVEVYDASKFIEFLSAKAGVDFHTLGQVWANSIGDSELSGRSPDQGDSVSGNAP